MTGQIQSVWPLAPGQGGILFQSIGGGKSGDYVIQILLDLSGHFDQPRAHAAWQELVARHAALRTAFVWRGQPRPVQVIGHRARLRMDHEDLTSHANPQHHMQEWLTQDRATGFALNTAPLLRVKLFTLASDQARMVVTFHHAVLDGWSIPVLLKDWVALYGGEMRPAAPDMADYLGWLHAQDVSASAAFWRKALPEAEPPWPLPAPTDTHQPRRGDLAVDLTQEDSARLSRMARRLGVTPAAVVQAAWALLQSRVLNSTRATWGLARAGRPALLPQVGARAGMYLTMLPVSIATGETRTLADLALAIQEMQHAQAPHEHLSLAAVHAARGGANGAGLIFSAVIFENYPTDPALLGQIPELTVTGLEVLEQTSMPLALFVSGNKRLRLLFDAHRIDANAAQQILTDIRHILGIFAQAPGTILADIAIGTSPTRTMPEILRPAPPASRRIRDRLAMLWADLLETDLPVESSNFFDLGGHSLLVITLQERIRQEFAVNVEIPDLFRLARLGSQAAHIAARQDNTTDKMSPAPSPPARQAGRARLRQRARTQKKDQINHV